MKALSILAIGLLAASGAMAQVDSRPGGGGGGGGDGEVKSCTTCPEINVKAPLAQVTSVSSSTITNTAADGAMAKQNISSNVGNVNINKATIQASFIHGSTVSNDASGNPYALATQSIASNVGKVNVDGYLLQVAHIANSSVKNVARANSVATQNISTNNGCTACN